MTELEEQLEKIDGSELINEVNGVLNKYLNPMLEQAQENNEKPIVVITAFFETIWQIIQYHSDDNESAIRDFEVFWERLKVDRRELQS